MDQVPQPTQTKFLIAGGIILVVLVVLFFIISGLKNPPTSSNLPSTVTPPTTKETTQIPVPESSTPETVIMRVGSEQIYQKDYDVEAVGYPNVNQNEKKKVVLAKLVSDSAILQGGKDAGFITLDQSIFNSLDKDYSKRISTVEDIKNKVMQSAGSVQGKIIAIWFYNNGFIGTQGYDKGKEIARQKITTLHDDIKNGKITIEQAGDQIKADSSLAQIDPIYNVNAIQGFAAKQNEPITFDSDFNKTIRSLPEGALSDVTLIKSGNSESEEPKDAVFMVAQVQHITKNDQITSLDQWILDQKKKYAVVTK